MSLLHGPEDVLPQAVSDDALKERFLYFATTVRVIVLHNCIVVDEQSITMLRRGLLYITINDM